DLAITIRTAFHDRFALATLLFKLLVEGTHPFDGVCYASEVPIEERIKAGWFPHSGRPCPCKPKPLAPPFEILDPALQQLFLNAFEHGADAPHLRPTPLMWQNALRHAEKTLRPCLRNPRHEYGSFLGYCPWCRRAALLSGADPFPDGPPSLAF